MVTLHFWTHTLISKITQGQASLASWSGVKFSIDTRTLERGDIFVAFKGEQQDGHDFVKEALKKGAAGAIVEHLPSGLDKNAHLVVVKNAKDALQKLAIYNREHSKAIFIGITGSVGKTSAKEILATLLKTYGRTYYSQKNFNNDLGLPLCLASMPQNTEFAIFELGMNHKGEIAKLSAMLRPNVALITHIATAHLSNFSSVEEIAKAKAEIFMHASKNFYAILPGDSTYYEILKTRALKYAPKRLYSFGEKIQNNTYLIRSKVQDGKHHIKADIMGENIELDTSILGKHQALNILASLSVLKAIHLPLHPAIKHLKTFTNVAGRGQVSTISIEKKHILLIDDSYNANPTSMKAALATLKDIADPSKVRILAILGEMYEIGENSMQEHANLASSVESSGVTKLITVGPLMKHLYEAVPEKTRLTHFDSYSDVIGKIKKLLQDNDCVLVKGSNATKMHKIVKYLLEGQTQVK